MLVAITPVLVLHINSSPLFWVRNINTRKEKKSRITKKNRVSVFTCWPKRKSRSTINTMKNKRTNIKLIRTFSWNNRKDITHYMHPSVLSSNWGKRCGIGGSKVAMKRGSYQGQIHARFKPKMADLLHKGDYWCQGSFRLYAKTWANNKKG